MSELSNIKSRAMKFSRAVLTSNELTEEIRDLALDLHLACHCSVDNQIAQLAEVTGYHLTGEAFREVQVAILKGNIIQGIKTLRIYAEGIGLKDAKNAVEDPHIFEQKPFG